MASGDINLDKQEYQSVFKVFDKDNTGEINIGQVYELINKFDDAQRLADGGSGVAGDASINTAGLNNGNPNSGALTVGKQNQKTTNPLSSKSPTKKPAGAGLGAGSGMMQLKPTAVEQSKSI